MPGGDLQTSEMMAKQKRQQQFNLEPVEGFAINNPSRTLTETSVRFHPVRVLAFVVSHFAPVTDFYVMAGLHNVGNVVLRVNLKHDECGFRPLVLFYFYFIQHTIALRTLISKAVLLFYFTFFFRYIKCVLIYHISIHYVLYT